jgi:hypothetical protein
LPITKLLSCGLAVEGEDSAEVAAGELVFVLVDTELCATSKLQNNAQTNKGSNGQLHFGVVKDITVLGERFEA